MNVSIYQKEQIEARKKKAIKLYKQGLTTREIGKILKKSHGWVWLAVRDLTSKEKVA